MYSLSCELPPSLDESIGTDYTTIHMAYPQKEPQHFCQGSGKSFLMGSTGCLLLRKLQRTCFING